MPTQSWSGKSSVFLMESALTSHGSSKSNKKPSDGRRISDYRVQYSDDFFYVFLFFKQISAIWEKNWEGWCRNPCKNWLRSNVFSKTDTFMGSNPKILSWYEADLGLAEIKYLSKECYCDYASCPESLLESNHFSILFFSNFL